MALRSSEEEKDSTYTPCSTAVTAVTHTTASN
ncbi:hypothetical protein V6N13_042304 [Hibiscus sabdariffa]|uniref:Uncharacterized protein n=1 Tax=Hibiscus sabdariffa TaxID=183260 RepID=A0ABR2DEN2_9ROSI